jgi:hypothetical protein
MVSLDVLKEKRSNCFPVKSAEAYLEEGYYPSKYCIKYWEEKDQFFISLENFIKKRK